MIRVGAAVLVVLLAANFAYAQSGSGDPTFRAELISADEIKVVFSEPVWGTTAAGEWRLVAGTNAVTATAPAAVTLAGDTELTLDVAAHYGTGLRSVGVYPPNIPYYTRNQPSVLYPASLGDSSLTYTPPATGALADADGNGFGDAGTPVQSTRLDDKAPPTFHAVLTSATTIDVHYSEYIMGSTWTDLWHVNGESILSSSNAKFRPSSLPVHTLTFEPRSTGLDGEPAPAVSSVTFTPTGPRPLRDTEGNLFGKADVPVPATSITPVPAVDPANATAPTFAAELVSATEIKVVFSEPVWGTTAAAEWYLTAGTDVVTATAPAVVTLEGETELELEVAAHFGTSLTSPVVFPREIPHHQKFQNPIYHPPGLANTSLTYAPPETGALADADGNGFGEAGTHVPSTRLDDKAPPTFRAVLTSATTVDVHYSERVTGAMWKHDWHVNGESVRSLSHAKFSSSTPSVHTLTFEPRSMGLGDEPAPAISSVTYTPSHHYTLRDLAGNLLGKTGVPIHATSITATANIFISAAFENATSIRVETTGQITPTMTAGFTVIETHPNPGRTLDITDVDHTPGESTARLTVSEATLGSTYEIRADIEAATGDTGTFRRIAEATYDPAPTVLSAIKTAPKTITIYSNEPLYGKTTALQWAISNSQNYYVVNSIGLVGTTGQDSLTLSGQKAFDVNLHILPLPGKASEVMYRGFLGDDRLGDERLYDAPTGGIVVAPRILALADRTESAPAVGTTNATAPTFAAELVSATKIKVVFSEPVWGTTAADEWNLTAGTGVVTSTAPAAVTLAGDTELTLDVAAHYGTSLFGPVAYAREFPHPEAYLEAHPPDLTDSSLTYTPPETGALVNAAGEGFGVANTPVPSTQLDDKAPPTFRAVLTSATTIDVFFSEHVLNPPSHVNWHVNGEKIQYLKNATFRSSTTPVYTLTFEPLSTGLDDDLSPAVSSVTYTPGSHNHLQDLERNRLGTPGVPIHATSITATANIFISAAFEDATSIRVETTGQVTPTTTGRFAVIETSPTPGKALDVTDVNHTPGERTVGLTVLEATLGSTYEIRADIGAATDDTGTFRRIAEATYDPDPTVLRAVATAPKTITIYSNEPLYGKTTTAQWGIDHTTDNRVTAIGLVGTTGRDSLTMSGQTEFVLTLARPMAPYATPDMIYRELVPGDRLYDAPTGGNEVLWRTLTPANDLAPTFAAELLDSTRIRITFDRGVSGTTDVNDWSVTGQTPRMISPTEAPSHLNTTVFDLTIDERATGIADAPVLTADRITYTPPAHNPLRDSRDKPVGEAGVPIPAISVMDRAPLRVTAEFENATSIIIRTSEQVRPAESYWFFVSERDGSTWRQLGVMDADYASDGRTVKLTVPPTVPELKYRINAVLETVTGDHATWTPTQTADGVKWMLTDTGLRAKQNHVVASTHYQLVTVLSAATTTTKTITVSSNNPLYGTTEAAKWDVAGLPDNSVTGVGLPGREVNPSLILLGRTEFVLTLKTPIAADATPDVTYTKPSSSSRAPDAFVGDVPVLWSDLELTDGSSSMFLAETPDDNTITVTTTDGIAPTFAAELVSEDELKITFSEPVWGTTAAGQWKLAAGADAVAATAPASATLAGDTELTLEVAAQHGLTLVNPSRPELAESSLTYTPPETAELVDAAGNVIGNADAPVALIRPADAAPTFAAELVSADELKITFSEPVWGTTAAGQWRLAAGADAVAATAPASATLAGDTELTLEVAAQYGPTLIGPDPYHPELTGSSLTYTPPATGALADAAGNGFGDAGTPVPATGLADKAPPTFTATLTGATTLEVAFSEHIRGSTGSADWHVAGDRVLSVSDAGLTPDSIAVYRLTIEPRPTGLDDEPALTADSVTYTPSVRDPLRDTGDNPFGGAGVPVPATSLVDMESVSISAAFEGATSIRIETSERIEPPEARRFTVTETSPTPGRTLDVTDVDYVPGERTVVLTVSPAVPGAAYEIRANIESVTGGVGLAVRIAEAAYAPADNTPALETEPASGT